MSTKQKKLLIAVGAILLLVALACTCADTSSLTGGGDTGGNTDNNGATEEPVATQEPSSNDSGIVVTDYHLYRDDGNGEPGEEVDYFVPSDRTMHFEVNTEGLPNGLTTKWVFTAVETTEGNDIEVASVETEETEDADQLTANLSLPNDWPTGTFKAEVYVGDELIYTIEYEVKES